MPMWRMSGASRLLCECINIRLTSWLGQVILACTVSYFHCHCSTEIVKVKDKLSLGGDGEKDPESLHTAGTNYYKQSTKNICATSIKKLVAEKKRRTLAGRIGQSTSSTSIDYGAEANWPSVQNSSETDIGRSGTGDLPSPAVWRRSCSSLSKRRRVPVGWRDQVTDSHAVHTSESQIVSPNTTSAASNSTSAASSSTSAASDSTSTASDSTSAASNSTSAASNSTSAASNSTSAASNSTPTQTMPSTDVPSVSLHVERADQTVNDTIVDTQSIKERKMTLETRASRVCNGSADPALLSHSRSRPQVRSFRTSLVN